MNENPWPHCGQNPSVRPGLPSRLRPIFDPHLEQDRLSSGTCASFMRTALGSTSGAGGTLVSPAPIRAERRRCEPLRVRRVDDDPDVIARAEPKAAVPTRLDEVTAETVSRGAPSPAAAPPPGAPAGAGPESAAMPQVSQ